MPESECGKTDAGGKKGKLLCCKHNFDRIKANLAEIQLKKHQNVQKRHFLQNVPGVNGLKSMYMICYSYLWRLRIMRMRIMLKRLFFCMKFQILHILCTRYRVLLDFLKLLMLLFLFMSSCFHSFNLILLYLI